MFDLTTPAVLLGGKSGPIDISDFIDLVDRSRRANSISWKRGASGNVLSHLCSCHIGGPEDGEVRNVSTPTIPEFTEFLDRENRMGIRARGWRQLLMLFVADGWVYPTQEIRKWLGDPMWDVARLSSTAR